MAAVFALVFVPLLVSIVFFTIFAGAEGQLSTLLAAATFIALGVGMLLGAFKVIKDAEEPEH